MGRRTHEDKKDIIVRYLRKTGERAKSRIAYSCRIRSDHIEPLLDELLAEGRIRVGKGRGWIYYEAV